MARADLERFPKLIIEIPDSQFPDKVRIIMKGRKVETKSKTEQLAIEAFPGRLETLYQISIWEERDFKFRSPDGSKRVVKVDMPYNEILSVSGWANRDDFEDTTPIDVSLYTTTSSGLPSASGTTINLDGVWSFQFRMNKQELTVDYCTSFFVNGTPVGQIGQAVANFASQAATIVAQGLLPALPTPKAIAAKLLGPAAPAVQTFIATVGYQLAKYKPTVEVIVGIAQAITSIIRDPSSAQQYLPLVFSFLLEFLTKEILADTIYDFQGGTI